jgi:hypothetical protein
LARRCNSRRVVQDVGPEFHSPDTTDIGEGAQLGGPEHAAELLLQHEGAPTSEALCAGENTKLRVAVRASRNKIADQCGDRGTSLQPSDEQLVPSFAGKQHQRCQDRGSGRQSRINRYDGARIEAAFGESRPEAAPRRRPEEVIGRAEEHGTVISHHRRHTPQDTIRDVNASAGIIRFGCGREPHAERWLGEHQVESLMRKVTKEEQGITQTPVQRRDTLGGPPQAFLLHEAAASHAPTGLMRSGEDRRCFDPRVEY